MSEFKVTVTTTRKEITRKPLEVESLIGISDSEIQERGAKYLEKGIFSKMSDAQIKDIILATVDYYTEKFQYVFGTNVACFESYDIKFDIRGRSVGGRASTYGYWISFNLDWARSNLQAFLTQVVPHEMAHVVADRMANGNAGHGWQWKTVMLQVGCNPSRTADGFSAKRARKVKRYIYAMDCPCGEMKISQVIHNKIQKGTTKRICKAHRHYIKAENFTGKVVVLD